MPVLKTIVAELLARHDRIRSGLDIGFADAAVSSRFRSLRGGTWMTVERDAATRDAISPRLKEGTVHAIGAGGTLPFDDDQFEVVILEGTFLGARLVKEIHRVLRPAGMLFLALPPEEDASKRLDPSRLYQMFLKHGFDLVFYRRARSLAFWRDKGAAATARKKAWHEHKGLDHEGSLPFGFSNAK